MEGMDDDDVSVSNLITSIWFSFPVHNTMRNVTKAKINILLLSLLLIGWMVSILVK